MSSLSDDAIFMPHQLAESADVVGVVLPSRLALASK
jgi:hypothetical protein